MCGRKVTRGSNPFPSASFEPFAGYSKWVTPKPRLQTSQKGVYAGGNVVSGPASVIEAVQMGRVGASSIDKYLGENGDIDQQLTEHDDPPSYLGRDEGFADKK